MGKARIPAETILDICEDVANGKTLTAAAKERGITPGAVRYRLMKDEELFAVSTRARESGCDALADECIEIADDPMIGAADKRIRIDTRIRLIGKWSKRYSDKVTVETTSTVTHRYDLDSLTDEELDALETLTRKAALTSGDTGGQVEAEPSSLH